MIADIFVTEKLKFYTYIPLLGWTRDRLTELQLHLCYNGLFS